MHLIALLAAALAFGAAPGQADPQIRPQQADGVVRLLADLESAVVSGRVEDFRANAAASLPTEDAAQFELELTRGPATVAAVRERSRRPVESGFEINAEVLIGRGRSGRLATWQLTVEPTADNPGRFMLVAFSELASLDGLVRLALDTTEQFELRDFRFETEDLTIVMSSGSAFMAKAPSGVTALVLRGSGNLTLAPPDPAEQGQLRLFAGKPDYRATFEQAFIRINPGDFRRHFDESTMVPVPVDPDEAERAQRLFDQKAPQTYSLDLSDLAPGLWSLAPTRGSIVVEFKPRRRNWLTYSQSPSEPEDITFFDREDGRNISVYASAEKLAQRGPDFSEDDDAAFDVERYGLDLTFDPQQEYVGGRVSMRLRIKKNAVRTLKLKLAEPLEISSITSLEHGHLLNMRVRGQDNVIVSLPRSAPRDSLVLLDITYGGRLPPQDLDREAVAPAGQIGVKTIGEQTVFLPETRYMYSNRVAWYPQADVTDYATAAIRLTVPSEYQVVASGTFTGSSLSEVPAEPGRDEPLFRRTVQYIADRPARYLSCVISRFVPIDQISVPVPAVARVASSAGGAADDPVVSSVNVEVVSTPRMTARNRDMPARVAEVLGFFANTIGGAPYPNFTLAGMDDNLPGGHSPPFFAVLHQPLPTTPYVWGSDPVAFDHIYDHFFLAHEIAHQWWGQAVGWKNYHEQWLSEGLAQYFAVLWAEEDEGQEMAERLLGRMRRSSESLTGEGPISLGYRLGHLKSDGRVFRAIAYNKSAVVLHTLRRLVGDDAFFSGIADFYETWRFQKAGTTDFRLAMQPHTSIPLERFFERWVKGSTVPDLKVTSVVDNARLEAEVRVEQRGDVFDLPLRVEVQYRSGGSEFIDLKVSARDETFTLPLRAEARGVQVREELILAKIDG